jgi:hypothetical protein
LRFGGGDNVPNCIRDKPDERFKGWSSGNRRQKYRKIICSVLKAADIYQ